MAGVRIAPSILSADFARLGEEIADVTRHGADWIHVDVMDGHFVPNLTIGPLVVEAARRATQLPLDVHLMIEKPERYVDAFVANGADVITVHAEACTHLHRTLYAIKEKGLKAGVALNPATSLVTIEPMLEEIDLLLVMTVNPGFGGQSFIAPTISKIQAASEFKRSRGLDFEIEVDGGINPQTAALVRAAGATVLVAGHAVFRAENRAEAIRSLRD